MRILTVPEVVHDNKFRVIAPSQKIEFKLKHRERAIYTHTISLIQRKRKLLDSFC